MNPTNVIVEYVSPGSASGSTGGRRPSNLTETESPVSEMSYQALPPTSPWPPRSSRPGQGSTQHNTDEILGSTVEENDQPQPPHPLMPIIPRISEHYSIQPRQPVPSDNVGGFAPIFSSHHGAGDRTHRFDAMSSPPSNSGPPHYKPADISGGIPAEVWPTYNKISQEFDEKRLKKWSADLDVLLISAILFSIIVTAFLIRALDDLGPNYEKQTALLLHQLLNGRDPNLTNTSDPTAPYKPNGLAIAVNCLWFISLSASLGASFGAMICKEWLAGCNGGANPMTNLLRACQRHVRFMAFQRWNVRTLIALLPLLLHLSVILFFAGAVAYLWQIDERVAILYQVIGGVFSITYFISTFLPFVANVPFRPYSTLLFHRLSVVIGKVVIPIVDVFVHACYLILYYVASAILFSFARITSSRGTPPRWYTQAATILPGEYKHMRVWWADMFNDSLDEIDTSQWVRVDAVVWLSQMPLDPSESKAVVSSLARISSSYPHKFPSWVIGFLNSALESSFGKEVGLAQISAPIDCVLALGYIKFRSVVDRNSDDDHNVGGVPVTASVAQAAQQLAINAFQERFKSPHSEGIHIGLLVAAAWLSPVKPADWDSGEKLKTQDRYTFIEEIRAILLRHVRGEKVLDNKVLINLIHGMHACIPRGDYGSASSIVSLLPFCEDYSSPWSEDESVLRALITYALDLLLPGRRRPLVEREIDFGDLASELVNVMMVNTTSTEAVTFGFWLAYRVPYAFESRKIMLADITRIWTSAIERIEDDTDRQRLSFHSVNAFVAVAHYHLYFCGTLPELTDQTVLKLLNAALESDYTRPMATYAIAMIFNLGKSTQVATLTNKIEAKHIIEALFSISGDLESGTTGDDVLDLRIYSVLVLLKCQPAVELDVGRVKGLIEQMEKVVGDPPIRGSGIARKPKGVNLDRMRWKAVYLSALLLAFMPGNEREKHTEGLLARLQRLMESGELSIVSDYENCLQPLVMHELELTAAEQRGPISIAYELWIDEFPLFPLAGSIASIET